MAYSLFFIIERYNMNNDKLKDAIDALDMFTIIVKMEIDKYKHSTDGIAFIVEDLKIDVKNLKAAIEMFEKTLKESLEDDITCIHE
jgi:hypothetical protein